jgi:hypothetical protein
MDRWIDGRMDWRKNGWMDWRKNGWMDRLMDGCSLISSFLSCFLVMQGNHNSSGFLRLDITYVMCSLWYQKFSNKQFFGEWFLINHDFTELTWSERKIIKSLY